jgi:nucleoid-associated protein YgaU
VSNRIQYHLSFNNGAERLQLPVNPASIQLRFSHGYQDVEAAQLGEITVIGNAKLTEMSFSSFFPRDYNSAYCAYTPLPDPWECASTIERWMRSGRPIRLTVTGTPINIAVTIRAFNPEPERGGSPGDIYYDLALKEYAFVSVRKVNVVTAKVKGVVSIASSGRPDTSTKPSKYTVVSGDTLWKIAQRVYSDGDRWREIYNANKTIIGVNPSLITPNQQLVIP